MQLAGDASGAPELDWCGACLTRGRRVSPLGAARAARVLHAAAKLSAVAPHDVALGNTEVALDPMSRLAVCWECRQCVERTVSFCDRVRRAQTILTSENLAVFTDLDNDISMSTLGTTTKIGFDYEFFQENDLYEGNTQEKDPIYSDFTICTNIDPTSNKVIFDDLNSTDSASTNVQPIDIITSENVIRDPNKGMVLDVFDLQDTDLNKISEDQVACAISEKDVFDEFNSLQSELMGSEGNKISADEDGNSASNDLNDPDWEVSPVSLVVGSEEVVENSTETTISIEEKESGIKMNSVIVMKDLTKNRKMHSKKNIKLDDPIVTIKSIKSNKVKECKLSNFNINKIGEKLRKKSKDNNIIGSGVIKMTPAKEYIPLRPGRVSTTFMNEAEMLESREEDRNAEHYVKSLFKCQTCIVGFNNGAFLEEHNRSKHSPEIGSHVCDICAGRFPSALAVTNHRRAHYHLHVCGACGHTQRQLADVNRHYAEAHDAERTYPCSQCGKLFLKLRQLRYHREKEHSAPTRCAHCGKSFSCRNTYNRHLELHTGMPLFECAVCGKACRGKALLSAHMRTHAAGGDDAYCAECDAQFKSKYIYRQHLRTSLKHVGRGDIKHACDACDKRFTSPGELRTHRDVVHLNKELFKCEHCGKSYVNARGLKLHELKVHEGVRPAKDKYCGVCGKGFSSKAILETHRRTHTGERPHACSRCDATFRQSGALYKHAELAHGRRGGPE